MELGFIVSAVKRRWWLPVAAAVVGLVAAVVVGPGTSASYRSTAVVAIREPSALSGPSSFSSVPDRYVRSQITVLESATLAGQVAARLGDPRGARLADDLEIEHLRETEIVTISATQHSAQAAQALAQTVAEVYIENLSAQLASVENPEISQRTERLLEIESELERVNRDLDAAMMPARDAATANGVPTPPPEAVAPALTTERTLLSAEYQQILGAVSELELASSLRNNSQIVQDAVEPSSPLTSRERFLPLLGVVGGLLLGLTAATAMAQLSPRVLDRRHAEELLGARVVGTLERHRRLRGTPIGSFSDESTELELILTRLGTRLEALAPPQGPLTITVIGTRRRAGCTTTALALAAWFARRGATTLVLDGDADDAWITHHFGLQLTAAGQETPEGAHLRGHEVREVPGLTVAARGDSRAVPHLKRGEASHLVAATQQHADVVIVDAGSVLDAGCGVGVRRVHIDSRGVRSAPRRTHRRARGHRNAGSATCLGWCRSSRSRFAGPPDASEVSPDDLAGADRDPAAPIHVVSTEGIERAGHNHP